MSEPSPNRPSGRLRVVVFNDSPTVRLLLRSTLAATPDFEVVAEAEDGVDAARVCKQARADLVLMDVVMPRCNGYEATRQIMAAERIPIVIVSSMVDPKDADTLFEAMKAGALFVCEPPPLGDTPAGRLKQAAFVQTLRNVTAASRRPTLDSEAMSAAVATPAPKPSVDVIGICASAGGPAALSAVLASLPPRVMPPVLLVQHLAEGFAATFASWLASQHPHPVHLATDGLRLERGAVYMAPDGHHLGYDGRGLARLSDAPPIGQFRPSATYLLRSLATAGPRALGAVLSGMGSDGAEGAVELRRAGGRVVVQNRESAAVYGMPQAALRAGGADEVLGTEHIGGWLMRRSGVVR